MGNGRRIVAGAFAALLLVSGCGTVARKAGEKIAEQASGCKNIDVNQGGGSVECDGQKINANVNGDGKLPDGFPADLAPPSGAKIYSSFSNEDGAGLTTWSVTASVPGEAKAVAEGLRTQFEGAGYRVTDDGLATGVDGVGGSISARNGTYEVHAIFGVNTTGTQDGGTYVSMTVRELSASEAAETTVPSTTEDAASDPSTPTSGGGSSSTGAGAALPDDWPSQFDPPSGTKVVQASSNTFNGKHSWYAVAAVPGTVQEVTDAIKAQLTGAGLTVAYSGVNSSGGHETGTVSGSGSALTAAIVITDRLPTGDDLPSGSVAVTFTLSEL